MADGVVDEMMTDEVKRQVNGGLEVALEMGDDIVKFAGDG